MGVGVAAEFDNDDVVEPVRVKEEIGGKMELLAPDVPAVDDVDVPIRLLLIPLTLAVALDELLNVPLILNVMLEPVLVVPLRLAGPEDTEFNTEEDGDAA